MRIILIFASLFLVHLCLVARCAMVAEPMYNSIVVEIPTTTLIPRIPAKLLPTASDNYGVYWYNTNNGYLTFKVGNNMTLLYGMQRCVKFNLIANPTQTLFVLAAITNPTDLFVLNVVVFNSDGILVNEYSQGGIPPLATEPGLAFINSTTFAVTHDGDSAVKRRSTTQTPLVYKSIGIVSLPSNLGVDLPWNSVPLYMSDSPQSGGSISAVSGTGDWLAVWDNQGAKNVLAYFGSNLTPSTLLSVSSPDGYEYHTPVVAYPFVAYVNSTGNLNVARVSPTQVLDTYNMGFGVEPHLYAVKGSKTDVIVLSYVSGRYQIGIRLQSVQYPTFSNPIYITEDIGVNVLAPSSLVLTNGTIVVVYTVETTSGYQYKTQLFPPNCGDLVISPNEECDGELNCAINCVCKPMAQRTLDKASVACPYIAPPLVPVAIPVASDPAPSVVPLLDCYTPVNSTHVRGYFSYENLGQQTVQVPIGSTNRFAFGISINNRQDLGQPTIFTPGRTEYFPANAFAVTWNKQALSWFLTKYQLTVDPTGTLYLCPQNVSVDVDVSASKLPNATELVQIAAQIAVELGVDPTRVIVTATESDGGITITITIIGSGLDSLASAIIAEKLVDVIKTNPDELEDSLKDVLPIDINSESVRGKPDAVTGQRGELAPTTMSPSVLTNTASNMFNIISFVISLYALVLLKL